MDTPEHGPTPEVPEHGPAPAVTTLTEVPSLRSLYATALRPGRSPGTVLPAEVLRVEQVPVESTAVAAYDRVCGFALRDDVPVTFPHVLAFPLQVRLMTAPAFPLPLLGLVHLRNTIVTTTPVRIGDNLDLRVHAEALRAHPKGAQVDLVATAEADGRLVWAGRSTYLARGVAAPEVAAEAPATAPSPTARPPADPPAGPDPQTPAFLQERVPADAGRRYAGVSGDVNPIHLSRITARPLGFPTAIAHGMWSAARCLAAMQGAAPTTGTYDVAFAKPVRLPSTVRLAVASNGAGGWDLALGGGTDRIHLTAALRP